jgi:hypothetical protein
MTKAMRYRLFGIGKTPPALKDAAAGSGVPVAVEGVSVRESVRSLRMARASVAQGTKLLVGSVVVRHDRLLASVSAYPIVDTDFGQPNRADSTLSLAEDGVRVTFEVASVLASGSGSVEVHYRLPLDATVLAQLPSISCPVSLSNAVPALLKGWRGSWAG